MSIRILSGIFLFLLLSNVARAAEFAYGTLNLPNSTQGVVRMRTLETFTDYVCDLQTLGCAAQSTGTLPSVIPLALEDQNPIMSPDGLAAVARPAGVPVFYRIEGGVPVFSIALPIGAVSRAFFLERNSKVLLVGGGEAVLVDTQSGTALYRQSFSLSGASFLTASPNGRFLAYYRSAPLSEPVRQHVLFSLSSGNSYLTKETIAYWDLLSEENRLFQFTADSSKLIYLSDKNGVPTLYEAVIDVQRKGKPLVSTRLFSKNYTVSDFLIGPDGALYYIANRENLGRWNTYRYDLKRQTLASLASNVSYATMLKTNGSNVYFNRLVSWGSEPVEYNLKTKTVRPFAVPHPATVIASGTRVVASGASGYLIKPDNFDPKATYPLVVWLHGGPYRHVDPGFNSLASYGTYDWMLENLRQSGVVILKIDYRGSYGYGRAFAEGVRGGVGSKDVADVLSVLAAAKKQVKAGSVYLTGVSYGGYLSLRTVVEKPALFAGAVSLNGVTDWELLLTNIPSSIFSVHFNGVPAKKNRALYDKASIVDRAHNLTSQKVLLIGSEQDSEVPYGQTVFMNEILTALEKQVEFVSYPGEDHVFKYRATAEDVCRRLFSFTGMTEEGRCSLAPAGLGQDQGLQSDGI